MTEDERGENVSKRKCEVRKRRGNDFNPHQHAIGQGQSMPIIVRVFFSKTAMTSPFNISQKLF